MSVLYFNEISSLFTLFFSLLVTILQILSQDLCQPQDCSNLSRDIKIIFMKDATAWKQGNILDEELKMKMLKVYLEWAGEAGEPSHSGRSAGGVF